MCASGRLLCFCFTKSWFKGRGRKFGPKPDLNRNYQPIGIQANSGCEEKTKLDNHLVDQRWINDLERSSEADEEVKGGKLILDDCPSSDWWWSSQRLSHTSVSLILFLVSTLSFLNSLNGDFVHDDIATIVKNPDVTGGQRNILNVFINDYWGCPMSSPRSHKSYRPVTILTFRLNYLLGTLLETEWSDNNSERNWTETITSQRKRTVSTSTWHFHLVNVILHSSVVQLMAILTKEELNFKPSHILTAGLYFGTHPIHTEAVSSIVGRGDLLSSFFVIWSFIHYCRALNESNWNERMKVSLLIYTLCAILGLLSKETGISVLPLAIAYYFYKSVFRRYSSFTPSSHQTRRVSSGFDCPSSPKSPPPSPPVKSFRSESVSSSSQSPKRATSSMEDSEDDGHGTLDYILWLLGPLVIPALTLIALLWFRVRMLNGSLPSFSKEDNPAAFADSSLTRFLTYIYLIAFNGFLLLCPSTLAYDWQMGSVPLVESILDHRNLLTLSFLGLFSGLSIRLYFALCANNTNPLSSTFSSRCIKVENAEGKTIFIGFALLFLAFLPASNLVFTVGFVVAERILYLPSIGFTLLIVSGLRRTLSNLNPKWIHFGFLILVLSFVGKTISRNVVWTSRENLFRSGLQSVPNNAKVHYNYANLANDLGNREEAIQHYRLALSLWPDHEGANNNLGTLLEDSGEEHFKRVLKINPFHPRAYFNLANIYRKRGLIRKAKDLYKRCIELDPLMAVTYSSLASIYSDEGRFEEAYIFHQKALEMDGKNADLVNNYAAFLQKIGQSKEALNEYHRAIKLQPNHRTVLHNLQLFNNSVRRKKTNDMN